MYIPPKSTTIILLTDCYRTKIILYAQIIIIIFSFEKLVYYKSKSLLTNLV